MIQLPNGQFHLVRLDFLSTGLRRLLKLIMMRVAVLKVRQVIANDSLRFGQVELSSSEKCTDGVPFFMLR